MTVMLFSFVLFGATVDAAAKQLAADVAKAMKRADLTQDYVARVLRIPPSKLSLQLSGQLPFTTLWRFFTNAEIADTEFRREFFEIQAERIDRRMVALDLGALVTSLQDALGKKPMAKMALSEAQKEQQSA